MYNMGIENTYIYLKTTRSTEIEVDRISDSEFFTALSTGIYKSIHATKNEASALCPDGNPVIQCEAVREAVRGTIRLISYDENANFTGWVGYERAATDCADCGKTCSVNVRWDEGKPTEEMRFIFTTPPENEIVLKLN